ncbi:conserved hypothetical protein [Candida dubliniensis CD36]|uniref:Uncharacterized protein n=1 Tax=Candida dubliniensis (strain CD36 / ATCC MYA-646 / CBS 7987 / NCPF 3949 / NRRL Y-17841) TaxID=573826 RepID=B9WCU9_CANDC|nr:conserved hypothetical protein [Candida dubliniensis CD36]CAX44224.1 conserved hypothetical protein [Candida dubliniensis CD36]
MSEVPNQESPSSSIFKQSNASSSTKIHGAPSSSQIANVDFNTLRKLNTNTSFSSNLTNSTTKTSNALSRLFTRNKSSSNISIYHSPSDDDSSPKTLRESASPSESSKSGNRLKIAQKLKFSKNQSSRKPELFLDTSSSISEDNSSFRKIVTGNSSNEVNKSRKNSMSSPMSTTFHSLFHRSHHNGSSFQQGTNSVATGTTPLSSKFDDLSKVSKATLCLSSNSSNSIISNPELAQIYNFTNPNISIEDGETNMDHTNSSFLDIHKKMLVPADSFIQNKLNKYHQTEVGLGIYESELDHEKDSKIYSNLYHYLKPLFTPSFSVSDSGRKVSMCPILNANVEEIASFVKESFCLHQPNERASLDHDKSFRSKTRSSVSSLGRGKIDDFDYRQLSNLFEKLMTVLSHNLQTAEPSEVSLQTLILNAWRYYNNYIRFYVLSVFQPLQTHLNELYMKNQNGSKITRIDDLLLVSFRKVFITEQGIGSGNREPSQFLGNTESDESTGNELFTSTLAVLSSIS